MKSFWYCCNTNSKKKLKNLNTYFYKARTLNYMQNLIYVFLLSLKPILIPISFFFKKHYWKFYKFLSLKYFCKILLFWKHYNVNTAHNFLVPLISISLKTHWTRLYCIPWKTNLIWIKSSARPGWLANLTIRAQINGIPTESIFGYPLIQILQIVTS